MKIGLIGGTGLYDLFHLLTEQCIETEYGQVPLLKGEYEGKKVYFLPRHGTVHGVLAPYVNYKANLMALKKAGVDQIIAVSAVGSVNPDIPISGLTLPDQLVDFTRRRENTYGKFSADMTLPFCPDLQQAVRSAAQENGQKLYENTTLICVDGPIYETRNELQLFSSWGMDIVGMTNATEAALARELGICFSVVTLSTDLATGFASIPPDLATHKKVAAENKEKVKALVEKALSLLPKQKSCQCAKSYNDYMFLKK
ncbi:MTAP family purine nucleoside phosphorylase [Neobacillus ginsengisoli]|uniref:Purine nucleoside phosphorylase n=1 Tax=Neobacillus ginsengisoli TaxID=904295 RepID=A0ABT9XVV7_9BACI|nr:MTAP family purine nucleoside phosphorylase [Neobacillus ginsengisoli]MDQ0199714.1 5'-methylthioadenosine phosphorylase [Neobacillus ginsengisoli]